MNSRRGKRRIVRGHVMCEVMTCHSTLNAVSSVTITFVACHATKSTLTNGPERCATSLGSYCSPPATLRCWINPKRSSPNPILTTG